VSKRSLISRNIDRMEYLENSPGLWRDLDEDFRQGGLCKLEFGAAGVVWGVKAYRDYDRQPSSEGGRSRPYVVMEEPFGTIPESLYEKASELYPNLSHYDQVDFVAVGVDGSWVMGVQGQFVFWDNIEAQIIKHLTEVWQNVGAIRNVELSPCRSDIYFIEPAQGKVAYHVPDAWFPHIRDHFRDHQYRLDIDHHPSHRPLPSSAKARPGSSSVRGRGRGRNEGWGGSQSRNFWTDPQQFGGGGHQQHRSGPSNFGPPHVQYPPQPYPPKPESSIHQYANNQATSGVLQVQKNQQGTLGNRTKILMEVIKVAPAVLSVGVNIATLAGCSVM